MSTACINDLPDVVLEYIFCYLSPYRDFKSCRLVSKAWYAHAKAAERKIRRDFLSSVSVQNVVWCQKPTESGPTISKRYSHSACVLGDSMYVFGGCTTANTTFNDLWRLDLATRRWIRPLTMGTYPPPKACASLVSYKENLLLFGGWTHTSPYPLHQAWRIFRHLHVYNCSANRWTQVSTVGGCPSMAGHSATMQGHLMVVFGGLHCVNPVGPFSSSNDVWVLDLRSYMWSKQSTTSPKPWPRYGHSQISLDDTHILIVGGCGGPNMLLNDVWLLEISHDSEKPWIWKEVSVTNREHAAPQLSFHPACKVGDRVVVLSKSQRAYATPAGLHPGGMLRVRPTHRVWVPPSPEQPARPQPPSDSQRDVCVNGTRGVLKRPLESPPSSSSSSQSTSSQLSSQPTTLRQGRSDFALPGSSTTTSSSSCDEEDETGDEVSRRLSSKKTALSTVGSTRPSVRPNARHNRQRQLELLDRMEQRLKALRAGGTSAPVRKRTTVAICPMRLYVLDVSQVAQEAKAAWLPLQPQATAASAASMVEEVILYSLVLGRGELILFGGIQKDLVNRQEDTDATSEVVSSSLHFITSKRDII
uniref:Putative f-box protein n=1 Tax=Amblyomma aureolatum TaxID=187763 RepID=A0A1E1X9C3_9ACAR